jgi:hypothetical protein
LDAVRVSDAHAELAHVRERQQQAAVVKELQAALAEVCTRRLVTGACMHAYTRALFPLLTGQGVSCFILLPGCSQTQQALKAKSDALDKLTLEAQADAQASTHQAREAAARAGLEAEVAGLKAQLEEAAAASIGAGADWCHALIFFIVYAAPRVWPAVQTLVSFADSALEDEAAALKASMQDAREGEAAACKELRDREQQVRRPGIAAGHVRERSS